MPKASYWLFLCVLHSKVSNGQNSDQKKQKTGKMNHPKWPQKGFLMYEKCPFSELISVKLKIIADSEARMYPLYILKF